MPQFCSSFFTFVQTPLHFSDGGGQPHIPPEHTLPAMHLLPHAPQFAALD